MATQEKRLKSISDVQLETEKAVLVLVSEALHVELGAKQIMTGSSYVAVDGYWASDDGKPFVLVEVFSHVGKVKSAQRHKIHADVLKLMTARQMLLDEGAGNVRLILAFACEECARAVTGRTWVGDTARLHNIEVHVIPADEGLRAAVLAAQARQDIRQP